MKRLLILSVLAVSALSACKKKKDSPAPVNTLISKVTKVDPNNGTNTYTIQYNADNTVSKISVSGSSDNYIQTFSYSPALINITNQYTMGGNGTDSVIIANSRVAGQHVHYSGIAETDLYYYDGSNNLAKQVSVSSSSSFGVSADSTAYLWQNGDLTTFINSYQDTVILSYDVSKPSIPGDYFSVNQLINNGQYINNAQRTIQTVHLIKSITLKGEQPSVFTYTYDGSGRISNIKIVDNVGEITTFALEY